MVENEMSQKCRLTGAELAPVFDLGMPCVSDFLKAGETGTPFPLCVAIGLDWPHLPQLTQSYPPAQMYRRYHYRSGTNEAMVRELRDVVARAYRIRPLTNWDTVLDIANNDGTLLNQWRVVVEGRCPKRVGIDPSDVAIHAAKAEQYAFVGDFFSEQAYAKVSSEKAAVVTCIAMFYDLDDPIGFLKEVRAVLADDGLLVLQVHHTGMMLETNAFDAICHEHSAYYDSRQLFYALSRAGLSVVDAEITSSNGGSIRLFAMPDESAKRYRKTIEGIAGQERWNQVLSRDKGRHGPRGFDDGAGGGFAQEFACWQKFAQTVEDIRRQVCGFLSEVKAKGKSVVGLGASTKGNTLLQFFGIGPDLLPCIADRQESKAGLTCAGSGIPIISESEMRAMKPDYLFVLPWHFVDGLRLREADLLAGGTLLFTPLPEPGLWGS